MVVFIHPKHHLILVEEGVRGVPVKVGRDGRLAHKASPQEQPAQEKAPHPALMSFSSTFGAQVKFSSCGMAHSIRVRLRSRCIFKLSRRLCITSSVFSPSLVFLSLFSHITYDCQ